MLLPVLKFAKSFFVHLNEEQKNRNDYEVGCIHTVNALMPLITDLIFLVQEYEKRLTDEA